MLSVVISCQKGKQTVIQIWGKLGCYKIRVIFLPQLFEEVGCLEGYRLLDVKISKLILMCKMFTGLIYMLVWLDIVISIKNEVFYWDDGVWTRKYYKYYNQFHL